MRPDRKTVIGIVAALALMGLGTSAYRSARISGNDGWLPFLKGAVHQVTLDADGFHPALLTIRRGDTVIFRTTKNTPFWPASDLHPTHDLYPAFDPREPIAADAQWAFRFDKNGEWRYHDHLAPYFRGKVIVAAGSLPAASACSKNSGSYEGQRQCWEEALSRIIEKDGIDDAFEELARLYEAEPDFAGECHSYAHLIGQAAYAEFASGGEFPVSPKTTYCGFGFYHGAMEAMLARTGNLKEARSLCAYMDRALAGRAANAGLACFHGIGHGVMDGADRRAWGSEEKLISPALSLCDEISSAAQEYYRCYSGVFNSLGIAYSSELYGLKLPREDPLKICRSQAEARKLACYTDMMTVLMVIAGDDLTSAARFVAAISEDRFATPAMSTLASLAVRQRLQTNDYQDAITACHSLEERLRAPCISGFGGGLMEFGEPNKEYKKAFRFCEMPALSSEERKACFENAVSYAKAVYPLRMREVCRAVSSEFSAFCPV